jgi:hypothetical protein
MTDLVKTAEKNAGEFEEEEPVQVEIRDLFNKNNCFDIFKNSMIEGEHIYEQTLNRQRLQLKISKQHIKRLHEKIKLIVSLKAIDKVLMIKARMRLIEL